MRIAQVMEFEADAVTITVFCLLFLLVTVLGFVAARWKRGDLGLSTNGASAAVASAPVITWFLLGGDLYTAYTFIAVPALVCGDRRRWLLRAALHDHRLPAGLRLLPRLWSVAASTAT